jgi:hypothetical protein
MTEIAPPPEVQVYARSLSELWLLGAAAVAAYGRDPEAMYRYQIAQLMAYKEWEATVGENLGSPDGGLKEQLDSERLDVFQVDADGRVRCANGKLMGDIVRKGLEASIEAASNPDHPDPRMWTQVIRDEGDVLIADKVDAMSPGNAHLVLSMEPKEAMVQDRTFWEGLGYRDEVRLQIYAKSDEGKLITGCFAIGASNESTWRQVLAGYGLIVPEGISCDEWTRHGIELQMTPDAALDLGRTIRRHYYAVVGAEQSRYSISELVVARQATIRGYFERYIEPLAEAVYTGNNNEIMQELAAGLTNNATALSLEKSIQDELARVARGEPVSAAMGRAMEVVIRYALAGELRRSIEQDISLGYRQPPALYDNGVAQAISQERLINIVVMDAERKITYGGCALLGITEQSSAEGDAPDPQGNYGGKGKGTEESNEACDYTHSGCYCSPYNDDGSERGTPLEVRARRLPDGKACCLRSGCGAWIGPQGKDIGGIARLAAARRQSKPVQLVAA